MGVFELFDDTACFGSFYRSLGYLAETCGERYAIPPLARQAFRAGYLGDPHRQPGSKGGWYDFLDTARPPTATMAGRGSGPRISRLRG